MRGESYSAQACEAASLHAGYLLGIWLGICNESPPLVAMLVKVGEKYPSVLVPNARVEAGKNGPYSNLIVSLPISNQKKCRNLANSP
jgi:hypothetical protein